MEAPNDDFRAYIAERAEDFRTEDQLADVLEFIEHQTSAATGGGFEHDDPQQLLGTVEAWSSLLSYATAHFYAPPSPWPHNLAGWGQKTANRITRAANVNRPGFDGRFV